MPKEYRLRNSLKQTHHLLTKISQSACVSSDSEESSASTDSGDLAHIPVDHSLSLENLSLYENNSMEDFNSKLNTLMGIVERMATTQTEHATLFNQIQSRLNENTPRA